MNKHMTLVETLRLAHYVLSTSDSHGDPHKLIALKAIKEALAQQEKIENTAWNEPTPAFYITQLSRNTIAYHNQVFGKQEFSKRKQADCVVPCWLKPQQQREPLTFEEKEHAFLITTTSDIDSMRNFFDGVEFAELIHGIKETK